MSVAVVPLDVSSRPRVTVLVPARDEESDIAACLESIAAQDLPLDDIEVLVIDGASRDGTARTAEEVLAGHGFARSAIVTNPTGTTPSNLNAGLEAARGDHICRVDARSRIPVDYVRRCLEILESRPDVVVVGGAQVAVSGEGARARGIARALNNPVGMGLSRYRANSVSGAADTVYLGFFRTDELCAAGGWDETWATNQDFELNRRMARTGVVWFEQGLCVRYIPRSTVGSLASQYHRFGRWKVRYWRITGDRPRPRQLVLLVAGAGGLVAALVALAQAARAPRRFVLGVIGAVVGASLFESATIGPPAGVGTRATSVAASGAVAAGWLSGIAREWLRPDRRFDRSEHL